MSEAQRETTAPEESVADQRGARLALAWVWPRTRVDELQGAKLTLGRDESADIPLEAAGVSRVQ